MAHPYTKVCIYTRPDGGLSVVVPVEKPKPGETDDDAIARIVAKDVPASATNVLVIDRAAVPADRTYRGAWERQGGGIGHNMIRARNLHRDRIREKRREAFADLDGQWMRATARGDATQASAVENKREAWRNAPADPAIDAAVDAATLKAIPLPPT